MDLHANFSEIQTGYAFMEKQKYTISTQIQPQIMVNVIYISNIKALWTTKIQEYSWIHRFICHSSNRLKLFLQLFKLQNVCIFQSFNISNWPAEDTSSVDYTVQKLVIGSQSPFRLCIAHACTGRKAFGNFNICVQ